MLNKEIQLYKLVTDFIALMKMDNEDFINGNINIDKLLFNANCRTYKLNHLVHNLKVSKDKIDKWINSKENKEGVEKLKKQNKEYNEKYQY